MTFSDLLMIILALFVLALFVAGQTARDIAAGDYSKRKIAAIALAWLAYSLAGFRTTCGQIGCTYSVKLTWMSATIANFVDAQWLKIAAMVEMTCYAALTFYILGHVFGWIRFGVGKAWRLAYR